MIAPFRNHLPVKIRFGDGVAGDLAEVLAAEGSTRPFVIMDEGLDGFIPGVAATLGAVPESDLDGQVVAERRDHRSSFRLWWMARTVAGTVE